MKDRDGKKYYEIGYNSEAGWNTITSRLNKEKAIGCAQ